MGYGVIKNQLNILLFKICKIKRDTFKNFLLTVNIKSIIRYFCIKIFIIILQKYVIVYTYNNNTKIILIRHLLIEVCRML